MGYDTNFPKKYEVFSVDLGNNEGSIMSKIRPCVVVSNNKANEFSDIILVCPISSKNINRYIPTWVLIRDNYKELNFSKPCIIMCEQIIPVSKSKLVYSRSKITGLEKQLDRCLKISLDLK